MSAVSSRRCGAQAQSPSTPHRFASGRPQATVFQTVSTCQIPACGRYDYWTSTQVRNLSVDPPGSQQKEDFQAKVVSLATPSQELHYAQSDGYSGVRTAQAIRTDESDDLSLLYVLEGRMAARYDKEEVVVTAGNFYLYDARFAQRLSFSRHRMLQIDVPRAAFESGGKTPAPALVAKALAGSRLTPLLRSHLTHVPLVAASMSPAEQQHMLGATEAFAVSILQGALSSAAFVGELCGQSTLVAAQRYIEHHLDSPDLQPAKIARELGCSRATLYRVFKLHGLTVAGYIRETRLQHLFRLLSNPIDQRPIAVLAQCCGLYDAPNLSQIFRKRFGLSPSDARATHHQKN